MPYKSQRSTASKPKPNNSTYGPNYQKARIVAFKRSKGICQFCGQRQAKEAHHWAMIYPSDAVIEPDDLIGLCSQCHKIATTLRKFRSAGGDTYKLVQHMLQYAANVLD